VFCELNPRSLLEINRCFGGTRCLNIQSSRASAWCLHQILSFTCLVDVGKMFSRNVGWISTDYTALHPRREMSSWPLLWEHQIVRTESYCTSKARVVVLFGRNVEPTAFADIVVTCPRVGGQVTFAAVLALITDCCQEETEMAVSILHWVKTHVEGETQGEV
jgi:hypothetical protein